MNFIVAEDELNFRIPYSDGMTFGILLSFTTTTNTRTTATATAMTATCI